MTLQGILQHNFRPNILIIGTDGATDEILESLGPLLDGPIQTCELPGPLSLPVTGCGALILRNVAALASEQQDQLMEWLDTVPGIPVVSVSASPLFARVYEGTFSPRLYYRLNMVLEDASPAINSAA